MESKLAAALYNEICKLPVIDTHEHLLWDEQDRCADKTDVLGEYLIHYLKSDVISAGLKPDAWKAVTEPGKPVMERWSIVEPYWEASRYTGYGRALDIAVQGIYGIDGVNRGTVEALNEAFLAHKKPGHYQRVLKDLCNIETSLLDVWTFAAEHESPFFKYIWQPMNFIKPSEPDGKDIFEYIETKHAVRVKSLDDWQQAMEAELDARLAANGVRILKCAIAYHRTLRFEDVEYGRAKELFAEALGNRKPGALPQFAPELQDYLMHRLMKLADSRNLTVQFHTGLLEGNGNVLGNSNPELLTNLFLMYPNVDFDLFHISYPYQGAACALVKMFPNVFIDMCWAHIISPSACVSALSDFLDAIPYTKISAFGGDYLFVDGVYGHLTLSRQNVSRTLAGKVEQGVFDEGKALEIAKALYYGNPKRIFKL